MVHPKTELMGHNGGGCSGEHPYNPLVIKLLSCLIVTRSQFNVNKS